MFYSANALVSLSVKIDNNKSSSITLLSIVYYMVRPT